jgi:virginiamycin B lyase
MQRPPIPSIALAVALAIVLAVASATTARAALVEVLELPENARPYSVAPQTFGKIWYTSQGSGALGIIDPATNEVDEIAIGEGSQPKTVVEGPDRAAWIVDSGLNAIVRIDVNARRSAAGRCRTTAAMPACSVRFSTTTACCGSPARPASTAASTPSPATWRSSTRPAATASTASRSRPTATSTSPRRKATISLGSIARAARRRSSRRPRRTRARATSTPIRRGASGSPRKRPARSAATPRQSGEWEAWEVPGESSRPYAIMVDDRDVAWLSDFGSNEVHVFDTTQE